MAATAPIRWPAAMSTPCWAMAGSISRGEGGDDLIIELGGDSVDWSQAGFDLVFVWSDTGLTLDLTAASIEWVQGSVPGDDNLSGKRRQHREHLLHGWGGNDVLTAGSTTTSPAAETTS